MGIGSICDNITILYTIVSLYSGNLFPSYQIRHTEDFRHEHVSYTEQAMLTVNLNALSTVFFKLGGCLTISFYSTKFILL